MTENELYSIILAANYLDIKPLMDLAAMSLSVFVKTKSSEELKLICQTNANATSNVNTNKNSMETS